MRFTLEALEAKAGDSLLLHLGTEKKPMLVVIDGGPGGVYTGSLKPRLEELRKVRAPNGELVIDLMMVTHIDDDHINGILQLAREMVKLRSKKQQEPFNVLNLWHNSFNDILGDDETELTKAFSSSLKAASLGNVMPAQGIKEHTALMLASVGQGRELRDAAKKLNWSVNDGFSGLVSFPKEGKPVKYKLGKATLTVIGPSQADLAALQQEWAKQIKKAGVAVPAEFLDDSVFNLSSVVVLAECEKKRILLTGDARGDEIIKGLDRAKLLKGGKIHVDVLKLPHHGSDRNVATSFFRTVTADHYVASGDGKHGNPEPATMQMLSEARGTDAYTIHLTNALKNLTDFFKADSVGKKYKVVFRDKKSLSLKVDLGDPVTE